MPTTIRYLRLAVPLAFAAGITACASNPEIDPRELQRAQSAIQDAKQVNAGEYAAATLAHAQDRLEMARQAIDNGKEQKAHNLVDEAAVLAQLAQAEALKHDSEQSLAQIQDSLSALRDQLPGTQQGTEKGTEQGTEQ